MHLFSNITRLFRGLLNATREPEVRGVLTLALTILLVATVFYWLVEDWPLLDAFYFSVVTIATVGYGDITPQTAIGKIFTVLFIFCGVGIFAAAVTAIAKASIRAERPPKE